MKKTPLFESHKEQGARFIFFAGWQMPFSYGSSTLEHHQVRKTGGLFDVSHMGEIRVRGKDSLPFLEKLLPADLKSLSTGKAIYSVLCCEKGGLIDDLVVYVCSQGEDYLLCVNAGSKDKDFQWMKSQIQKEDLDLQDESDRWALFAVQGPNSLALCEKIFPAINFQEISKFHFLEDKSSCLISRTGYTGEEGVEVYIPIEKASSFWNQFLKEGQVFSISPIGLGARDTLRLEMAYLLSGQDFDETKSPLQAGLSWLLKNQGDYIGKSALLKQKAKGNYSQLKGFIVEEASGIPRKGCQLYSPQGEIVGYVTSGAKSPSLEKMIGLAYIQKTAQDYYLDIRGAKVKVQLVQTPFLKKT